MKNVKASLVALYDVYPGNLSGLFWQPCNTGDLPVVAAAAAVTVQSTVQMIHIPLTVNSDAPQTMMAHVPDHFSGPSRASGPLYIYGRPME